MWRSVLAGSLAVAATLANAGPQTDEAYAHDGLSVVYRTDSIVYAVDAQQARLTDQGISLWLQTDFALPQGVSSSTARQTRNLARADVDCFGHRISFSQIRYYGEGGELVGSADPKTPWMSPKEGSIGQALIHQICVGFVPANGDELNTTAARQSSLPANAIAQTHPFQGQEPSRP